MRKLTYKDKEAIKEFEEITLQSEINKIMTKYNNLGDESVRIIPWHVYFKKHEGSIIDKIKERFKFQFI